MVKWPVAICLCLLTLCVTLAAQAAEVSRSTVHVQVSSLNSEFGKPLTLTITYHAPHPALTTLDIASLRQNFYVIAPANVETTAQGQRWQLRLYAYHPGKIIIPALALPNAHSLPVQIEITAAIDAKTHTPMEFSNTLSTTTPWLKQAIHINAELITTAPLVVLEANHPSLEDGLLITQPVTRESIDTQHTRHHLGWVWFPQRSGTQSIEPLLISVQRDGVITHNFYLQPKPIEVQALPPYVPATLPVGRFTLQQTSPRQSWLLTQRLYSLGLELTAIDMLPRDIPALDRQLPSTPVMALLSGTTQQHQTITPGTFITNVNYKLPFTLNHSGMVAPSVLQLHSFDPKTGRLHTDSLSTAAHLAVAPWLLIIGLVLLLTMTIAIGIRLLRRVRSLVQRVRGYRHVLQQLDNARSAADLRRVLQLIAVAEGWPANLTLSTWQRHWQKHPRDTAVIEELTATLSKALYRGKAVDLVDLAQQLRVLCRQRITGLAWLH